jgi:hypothetical protein
VTQIVLSGPFAGLCEISFLFVSVHGKISVEIDASNIPHTRKKLEKES